MRRCQMIKVGCGMAVKIFGLHAGRYRSLLIALMIGLLTAESRKGGVVAQRDAGSLSRTPPPFDVSHRSDVLCT